MPSTICSAPHIFPDQGTGGDPRACPSCDDRAPQPQGRQVRRVHRLLELPRLPLHPPARRTPATRRLLPRTKCSAPIPETGLDVTAPHRPVRSLRPARRAEWRREAEARLDPQGHRPAKPRAGLCARPALAAARGGLHPESGKPIVAGFGRYGPYIQHDGKYASLGGTEEVFEVGLNRAVSLLAEKAASSRGTARRQRHQGARRAP